LIFLFAEQAKHDWVDVVESDEMKMLDKKARLRRAMAGAFGKGLGQGDGQNER
jgi:hypothetical protein